MKRTIELSLETAKEWYKKGNELKEVALQAYSEEELKDVKTWNDINMIDGYYIDTYSNIKHRKNVRVPIDKNTFKTEKQAKSALAMAQLSQLLPIYNEGWELDWTTNTDKYNIINRSNKIDLITSMTINDFLAFKTEEIRTKFLKNNEQLVKDYLMID